MFSFGKALVLLILFLALLGKGIKFPFTILLRQFFFRIISLLCIMLITELLKVGSVVQCPCPPVVVNPLSVSFQPNGKKRFILDLRHVNFFVKKSKIKFEDAKSFLECLVASPCAWACSFDIKSSYHHIEIFESDQQFLGFSWVFDGVTKYFKFTVLPFGLSVGPYIFSNVMRPLVKYWRSKAR